MSQEEWQEDPFAAYDVQKRLDRLSRQQKQEKQRSRKKPTVKGKRKATARPKVRKAVVKRKSKIKAAAKTNAKTKTKAKKRVVVARSDAKLEIVREGAVLQRCLQAAGYFNETITGRLEQSSLQAFVTFRDDNDLRHRPNNLYDPVIQKALFEQCPEVSPSNLNVAVANVIAGENDYCSGASKHLKSCKRQQHQGPSRSACS